MAGRKTFALTQQEMVDLDKHIRALPFKRNGKCFFSNDF
ncbi:hypothetical protein J568_4541 [Acinetobacter baumannii 6112]|nr:hypothetical protein J568_4541 [Acinetobacter baumannii 6112]